MSKQQKSTVNISKIKHNQLKIIHIVLILVKTIIFSLKWR
jgi:hypothetical protein